MVYGGCMKPNRILAVVLFAAAAVCFWVDTIDKAHSDWKLAIGGIALVLLGLWVGKFTFKRNK
jgi:hypothetical protein